VQKFAFLPHVGVGSERWPSPWHLEDTRLRTTFRDFGERGDVPLTQSTAVSITADTDVVRIMNN
jgi:hypothetical protein